MGDGSQGHRTGSLLWPQGLTPSRPEVNSSTGPHLGGTFSQELLQAQLELREPCGSHQPAPRGARMRQSVCGRECVHNTYAMAAGELQRAQRGGERPFPSIHACTL
eukprot:3265936-Prymnesium_polylepis.1